MSVPAPPSQHRPEKAPQASPAVPAIALVVSAAAAGTAVATAPAAATTWTLVSAAVAWCCVAVAVLVGALLVGRARRAAWERGRETDQLRDRLEQLNAESAYLVNVTMPAVVKRLRDGTDVGDALTSAAPPSDPQLRRIMHTFATACAESVQHAGTLSTELLQARQELEEIAAEVERLTHKALPAAVAKLHEGSSADTVLAEFEWSHAPMLRAPAESFVRELARSERRAAAAQATSAKSLSRVQAKAVSMLADLREMQERHGEEVFGDLLKLDHSTSQLGLMTDRLALLMGGRSSRAWNKPIVMESILRGAVGRIAAYRRVRLHSSSTAAVSGFAAEGVMHLLAELMDNAANFSPPIDEVHVYVEERSAGTVVTIEDSGLKMADAAMRHAEEAVAGLLPDLASLQGTRLGLAVVGRLATKYGIDVNFRPSSRGGTGVVVLLPPQLLAQQRDPGPGQAAARPPAAPPVAEVTPAAPAAPAPAAPPAVEMPRTAPPRPTAERPTAERPAARPELPGQGSSQSATPNGLPVRRPGRTMAEAEREREQRRPSPGPANGVPADGPARDAGSRFGAFHRGRQSGNKAGEPESGPPASS
ncbi:ATP-binding protein [Streptomyces sp. NBRC 110035]|uniref:ATP-binding protein n=1 Tax=Streptomyces sp. NBRC 110035 TaxID=1547867 RepID=UPI0005AAAFE1|nr:ATP-binding protein [Streptomyces sp. NBRC 110035]